MRLKALALGLWLVETGAAACNVYDASVLTGNQGASGSAAFGGRGGADAANSGGAANGGGSGASGGSSGTSDAGVTGGTAAEAGADAEGGAAGATGGTSGTSGDGDGQAGEATGSAGAKGGEGGSSGSSGKGGAAGSGGASGVVGGEGGGSGRGGSAGTGGGAGQGGMAGGGAGMAGGGGSAGGVVQLSGSATADVQQSGHEANLAVDGDLATRWSAADANANHYVTLDLGAEHTLDHLEVVWEYPPQAVGQTYGYQVYVATNSSGYTLVIDEGANTDTNQSQSARFPASTSGRYVRVIVSRLPPPDVNDKRTFASIYELRVFGLP